MSDPAKGAQGDSILLTAAIAALFVLCDAVVVFLLNPVQALVLPEITRHGSLIFLPHGVRVLATVVLREKAIPGLLLGSAISIYFLRGITEPAPFTLLVLVSGLTAWAVFESLAAFRLNAYFLTLNSAMPPLRIVLLAGVLCSAANAFFMTSINEVSGVSGPITQLMAAYTLGDMTGLLASWFLAKSLIDYAGPNEG